MASLVFPPPGGNETPAVQLPRLARNWQCVTRPKSQFFGMNLLQAIEQLPAEVGANKIIPLLDLQSRRNLADSCSLGHRFVNTLSAVYTPVYRDNESMKGWYWASETLEAAGSGRHRRVKCSLGSDNINLAIAVWDGSTIPLNTRTTVTALAAVSSLQNLSQLEIFKCETLSTSTLLFIVHDLKQLKRVVVDDCLFVDPELLIKEWVVEFEHISLDMSLPTSPQRGMFSPISTNAHFHVLALVLWAIPFLTKKMPHMLASNTLFFKSIVKGLRTQGIEEKVQALISICKDKGAVTEIEGLYSYDYDDRLSDYEVEKIVETQLKIIAQTPYTQQALAVFVAVHNANPHLNATIMKSSKDPAGTRLFYCDHHGPMFGGLMTKEQRKVYGDDTRECFAEVMELARSEAARTHWFDHMATTDALLSKMDIANRVYDQDGNSTIPGGRRFADANHRYSCKGFEAGVLDARGRVVPASRHGGKMSTIAASSKSASTHGEKMPVVRALPPKIPVLVSGGKSAHIQKVVAVVPTALHDKQKSALTSQGSFLVQQKASIDFVPAPHHKLAKTPTSQQQSAPKVMAQEPVKETAAVSAPQEIDYRILAAPHRRLAKMQESLQSTPKMMAQEPVKRISAAPAWRRIGNRIVVSADYRLKMQEYLQSTPKMMAQEPVKETVAVSAPQGVDNRILIAPHHRFAKMQICQQQPAPKEMAPKAMALEEVAPKKTTPIKNIMGSYHNKPIKQQHATREAVPTTEVTGLPKAMLESPEMVSPTMPEIQTTPEAEAHARHVSERAILDMAVQEALREYRESVAAVNDAFAVLQDVLTAPLDRFCCRLSRRSSGAQHGETCDNFVGRNVDG